MITTTEMRVTVMVVGVNNNALDASNMGGFKEELKSLVAAHKRIVLDLTPVDFIDSSGLGAILSALRQANGYGGDIKLAHLTRPARVVIELTRMHRIFEIFETVEAAVRSYEA